MVVVGSKEKAELKSTSTGNEAALPHPPPGGVSLWGRSRGPQCSWPQAARGNARPAESYPQCCFDRKIRCPEGVYPRVGAPCLLISVGEISIHLGKGAGDSCQCRQFQGWKTSLEITKCHILSVILIKIAQNFLYKKEKKKGKNEYNAFSRSEVFTVPALQM